MIRDHHHGTHDQSLPFSIPSNSKARQKKAEEPHPSLLPKDGRDKVAVGQLCCKEEKLPGLTVQGLIDCWDRDALHPEDVLETVIRYEAQVVPGARRETV